jgi:hypothetical protein
MSRRIENRKRLVEWIASERRRIEIHEDDVVGENICIGRRGKKKKGDTAKSSS